MNKSTEIGALAEALAAAQGELTAAPFNAKNNFLGNEYADIGSFIDTAKSVLARHKLAVSQAVTSDDKMVGVTTILMHASGQWLESSIALEIGDEKGKSRAQVAGSIITYLRRYGYSGILGMYSGDEDDDGNTSKHAAPRTQAQATAPAPKQTAPAPMRQSWAASNVLIARIADGIPYYGGIRPHIINALNALHHVARLCERQRVNQCDDHIDTLNGVFAEHPRSETK